MTRMYRTEDAPIGRLATRKIAVLGYGNQGRAQALNLRDSGARLVIGNIDDAYKTRALEEGFAVLPFREAVRDADMVLLLLPDEILPSLFAQEIAPWLKRGTTLVFASGYAVTYETITIPEHVSVVLLGPRMTGVGVRELYLSRAGFYSFVAVHRDVSGQAKADLLALAHGIGTLTKGALEVTFKIETELDLFNEQAFGPAFGRVLLTSINTLLAAGYPREAVLLEFYMSGELSFIMKDMAEHGLIEQLECHSPTSQYGALSRGIQFLSISLARPMKKILAHIQRGGFAREWKFEEKTGKLRFRLLKFFAKRQPIGRLEKEVRRDIDQAA